MALEGPDVGRKEPETDRAAPVTVVDLFQEAGFERVEASAQYISYGTPDRVRAFAYDRATECRDQELQAAVTRYGIASVDELLRLAEAWGEWSKDPGAFFAFAWCRVLAWP
jgi:hypothetical protein